MTERRIRAIVVDDEASGRASVRTLLGRHPDVVGVAECATGEEAVRQIRALEPDLVFLDVQLPGFTGVEVLRRIAGHERPAVIFVTAYEDYALPAFDHHAVDYLLKPYSDSRFDLALERARRRLATGSSTARPEYPRYLPVGTGTGLFPVPVTDIRWVEAAGDYARVHVEGRSFLVRATMDRLAQRLDPTRFVRVHRSTIVSLEFLREIRGSSRTEQVALLKDGTVRAISERGRDLLSRALGLR